MPQESFRSWNRRHTLAVVGQLVAFAAFLAVLVGLYLLWRYVAEHGVLPVVLATLALALLLILAGALWRRPFAYAGVPLAWLAMAVLVVERGVALGLNAWLAAVGWVVASVLGLAVYNTITGQDGREG
jgi:hypothetical protein